jgi:sugar transferase (PEP-CTERM/EpsH1 system associated)
MRILLLTPRLPYPPYRGDKLKIFNLIKRLSKRHSIHLVSFVQSKNDLACLPYLRPYCKAIDVVPLSHWRSLLQCLTGLFSDLPLQVHYFKSGRMKRLIDELCRKNHYDIVHTHLIRMAPYTMSLQHQVKVLDLTDAVSLYLERFLSQETSLLKKLLLKIELDRVARYENVLEKFDACFVCSEPDKKHLQKAAAHAEIKILPNGVDLEYFSCNSRVAYDPTRIIFTGNLTYYPNVDGIFYFINDILPLIKKEFPAVKFYIVGQAPPAKVRALASENVIVTGFVEDIKLYYLQSAVAISPIRFGAGTLNKILEPLTLGVPVVATTMGIDGLDSTVRRNILVAEHPRAFAKELIRVIKDPDLRERLGSEGMAAVRQLYDWDTIVNSLENLYYETAMEYAYETKLKGQKLYRIC